MDSLKSGTIKIGSSRKNPRTVVTDSNGEYTTEEILASEFGGEYIIEAALVSKPSLKDTVHIFVRVPGLELLPTNNNIYNKIGGTEKHYGPPRTGEDHNHWGTRALDIAIVNLSLSWYNKFSNVPRLQINDMSLPFGGLFDYDTAWQTPHNTHRTGDCVDIQSKFMFGERFYDANRNGWYDKGVDILNDNNHNGQFDGGQLILFKQQTIHQFTTVKLELPPVTKNEHWHLIKR